MTDQRNDSSLGASASSKSDVDIPAELHDIGGLGFVRLDLLENWYTDNQFAQLDELSTRDTIECRWRIFKEALAPVAQRTSNPVRILDAGCGDGVNLLGIHEIVRRLGIEAEFSACDYSSLRVERLARLGIASVVEQCPLHKMPFRDRSFDFVLCNHVLEHIADLVPALDGLQRVVATDGILVINVPNEGCTMAQLRNKLLQPHLMRQTDHVHFFTRETLRRHLYAAELKIVGWRYAGFFYPHTRLFAFMKSGRRRLALTHFVGRIFSSQSADLIALTTPSER